MSTSDTAETRSHLYETPQTSSELVFGGILLPTKPYQVTAWFFTIQYSTAYLPPCGISKHPSLSARTTVLRLIPCSRLKLQDGLARHVLNHRSLCSYSRSASRQLTQLADAAWRMPWRRAYLLQGNAGSPILSNVEGELHTSSLSAMLQWRQTLKSSKASCTKAFIVQPREGDYSCSKHLIRVSKLLRSSI